MCTTAALSTVPPPVRLEQERTRKKRKVSPAEILKKSKACSAAGKRKRTQANATALGQYMKKAGSPQQVASAVVAFQDKPTWKAGVSALYTQIKRKDMAKELAKELEGNASTLMAVITHIRNGNTARVTPDLLLVVQLYIIKKYHEKCGGPFR